MVVLWLFCQEKIWATIQEKAYGSNGKKLSIGLSCGEHSIQLTHFPNVKESRVDTIYRMLANQIQSALYIIAQVLRLTFLMLLLSAVHWKEYKCYKWWRGTYRWFFKFNFSASWTKDLLKLWNHAFLFNITVVDIHHSYWVIVSTIILLHPRQESNNSYIHIYVLTLFRI